MKTRTWKAWKGVIGGLLAILLLADAGLAIFLWHSARQNPVAQREARDNLKIEARLLNADVERGERIRASLPQVGRDCDRFYGEAFLDSGTGYSEIESDLDQIANKSGLKMGGLEFKQKDVSDRGVTELSIKAEVEGNYSAIIQFINGLERSRKFYLLQDLELQSATNGGGIRLQLALRTFFKA